MLRATLTEPILAQVVGLDTSLAIWECLQQHFSQQSLANATHLRFQLFSINKGSKSISEYLSHAKSFANQLAAINEPMTSTDLVTSVLRGLGPDYAMLVTAILNFPPLPPFSDLRARLLSFESQQAFSTLTTSPAPSPTAFFSSHGRGLSSRGRRCVHSGHGRFGQLLFPSSGTTRASYTNYDIGSHKGSHHQGGSVHPPH
ncbi:hypothetical protein CerSpe_068630 [Prunus speciosa]